MEKTFDVLVNKKETVRIAVQMCESASGSYPDGSATASAVPVSTRYYNDVRYVPNPDPSQAPTAVWFRMIPGEVLRVGGWDDTAQAWVTSPRPDVQLIASYSQSTGIITVDIPFGVTFNAAPGDELHPAHSPRRYGYSVKFAGVSVLTGAISVESPRAPVIPGPEVCSVSLGASSQGSQPESPWVVEG